MALLSLFDADGRLLVEHTASLAARLHDAGADSFLVAGTAGEFWTLTDSERVELVAAVRAALPDTVHVSAHVGGVDQHRSADLARSCAAVGADAVIALPMGIEDLAAYYGAVVEASGGVPVLAYLLPGLGMPIPLAVLEALGVSGIKDSSGDGPRLVAEVGVEGLSVLTGAPALLGLAGALGGAGALTGVANLEPRWCAAAWHGDTAALVRVAQLHLETESDFPRRLKAAASSRWGTPAYSRRG